MRKWFALPVLALGLCSATVVAQQVQQAQVGRAEPAQVIQVAPDLPVAQIAIDPADVNMARALIAPGPGFGARNVLGQADAIVVGRVIALEPMDVQASPAPNQPNQNYRIAVVQVTESIYGVKKDVQTIRIGFIAQNAPVPGGGPVPGGVAPGGAGGGVNGVQIQIQPAIQPVPPIGPGGIRPRPGFGGMNLQMGQDGIFTLVKHHKENFYVLPGFNSFVNRQNNPNFDNEVKNTKNLAKVIGDPIKGLKAEDQQERFLAAAILINKYRQPNNPTGQPMKTEKIDAEESKLILKALAQGDWTVGRFNASVPGAMELFYQLGITPQDGYNPQNIRNQQDVVTSMQKWLADNSDKFVIQKLVVDPNAKVQPINPKVRPPIRIQPVQPGQVQPLPAPIQIDPAPAQDLPAPAPAPLPIRRN